MLSDRATKASRERSIDMNLPVDATAASAPVALTPVPQMPVFTPAVTPPPLNTEIVLPKPDTTPEVQAQLIGQNVLVAAAAPPLLSPGGMPAQNVELAAAKPAPADAETEIRVFRLKYGSPTEMANELGSVFPKARTQGGENAQQVNAVADARTQSLIVTAPKDLMPEVAGLMDELDVASDRDQKSSTVELKNGDPQQVASVLQNMFGNNTVARNDAGSSQNSALQQRRAKCHNRDGRDHGRHRRWRDCLWWRWQLRWCRRFRRRRKRRRWIWRWWRIC